MPEDAFSEEIWQLYPQDFADQMPRYKSTKLFLFGTQHENFVSGLISEVQFEYSCTSAYQKLHRVTIIIDAIPTSPNSR